MVSHIKGVFFDIINVTILQRMRKTMTIKNNIGASSVASNSLATDLTSSQAITYDGTSTITAIGNGKTSGATATSTVSQYQSLLQGDASRIGSLGEKFQAIDQAISAQLNIHF